MMASATRLPTTRTKTVPPDALPSWATRAEIPLDAVIAPSAPFATRLAVSLRTRDRYAIAKGPIQ